MIVRLVYFNFAPAKMDELKKFYNEVAAPTVRKQKGNLDCKLLEPADGKDEYISMSVWETKEDSEAYDKTGVYKNLLEQARKFFTKDPVLRVYKTESILEHA